MVRWGRGSVVGLAGLLAGCATAGGYGLVAATPGAPGSVAPASQSWSGESASPARAGKMSRFAESLCRAALPDAGLSAWGETTVGGLRDYHHGGPTPTYPLQDAFPGVDPTTAGAWCVTVSPWDPSAGPSASWPDATAAIIQSRWWGVTAGNDPQLAMTVVGPGVPLTGDIGADGPVVP